MSETTDREMTARLTEATGSSDPEIGLAAVAVLRGLVEVLETLQVNNARAKGWSWQDIARRLGISKQAVHQKHGPGATRRPGGGGGGGIATVVGLTEAAQEATGLAGLEAERLQHPYYGPEHLLLGLLRQADNPAAALLREHGLDMATVEAKVSHLIAEGVLPGPRASDQELLATLGIDLEAVTRRLLETFGLQAVGDAVMQVRTRPRHAVARPMLGFRPLLAQRALVLARDEAIARGQEVGPLHLLLGLLRVAQDPAGTGVLPGDRETSTYLGLPLDGPHPHLAAAQGTGPDRGDAARGRASQARRRQVTKPTHRSEAPTRVDSTVAGGSTSPREPTWS